MIKVKSRGTGKWIGMFGLGVVLATTQPGFASETTENGEQELTAECIRMQKDVNADLGKQNEMGCPPSLEQMAALMDNPVGNIAMLFTQFDFYKMTNDNITDESATKSQYMGIAQFPKGLGDDWNLINRFVWTVPSVPLDQDKIDTAAGGSAPLANPRVAPFHQQQGRCQSMSSTAGLLALAIFTTLDCSPLKRHRICSTANSSGDLVSIWVCPRQPTTSSATGKWTAGPSAIGVYLGKKWKIGGLLQQYWDYAGDDDRDDVSLTNLQYFLYYSLDKVTSIGAGPNIIANWEQESDDRWTVPVGLGINRTFQFGKVPVRIGVEAHYSVIQPDNIPSNEWDVRFYIIPSAPAFLFSWMQ
jgi:hypothetical protein